MIVIDGRQSTMQIGNFANLEQILANAMENEIVEDHIVTDVLVNDESFSEIYPHHAEDITIDEIRSVEIKTVSANEMASDINQELFTVIKILQQGSKSVADNLRSGNTAEGLELLQDLLDVTRNFLATISALSQRFPSEDESVLSEVSQGLNTLLQEMSEVMSDNDWLMMSDLLEFEFLPACAGWEKVLNQLTEQMASLSVK